MTNPFALRQVPTITTGGTSICVAGPPYEWRGMRVSDMTRDQAIKALYQAIEMLNRVGVTTNAD